MTKNLLLVSLLIVLLNFLPISSQQCNNGSIYLHQGCIECKLFPNTISIQAHKIDKGICLCRAGYKWSQTDTKCLLKVNQSENAQTTIQIQVESLLEQPKRLLVSSTCSPSNGFIFKNNICINCRLIPYSLGTAFDNKTCYCKGIYSWWSYYQVCGCYYSGSMMLYQNAGSCTRCDFITDATVLQQCLNCNGGIFGYSIFGCLNCTSIPFGTGATAGTNIGSCTCQTGYKWSYNKGACICNINSQYAISSSNTCGACSAVTPSTQATACASCSSPYYYTGYTCKYYSALPNLSSTNTCPTGFALKTEPIFNQTIMCACSSSLGYFVNLATCTSCSSIPAGVTATTTGCTSCSQSQGFFKNSVECIYCPKVTYATGAVTLDGCTCQANYYWNIVTSKCQCDWLNNFIGGSAACFNCSSVSNSASIASLTDCICLKGYKWNSTTKLCQCDTSISSFLGTNLVCIDCFLMVGSIGLKNTSSCNCVAGYTWDIYQQRCVCDFKQNFYISNGICYDCLIVPNGNGFASAYGCGCKNGLIWVNSTGKCDCPSGFVNLGNSCGNCSTITLPTGATVAGCKACSLTQGFYQQNGICFACSKQQRTTGVATSAGCTCTSNLMVWMTDYRGCVCMWKSIYSTTTVVNGLVSCQPCGTAGCNCGYAGTGLFYDAYGICTKCTTIPNSDGTNSGAGCGCNAGYSWTTKVYPYQCYCSSKAGSYQGATCALCSTLPSTGTVTSVGCSMCSNSQGFLLVGDICIKCSAITNSNGLATINGCGCTVGKWNLNSLSCASITCTSPLAYDFTSDSCMCDLTVAILTPLSICKLCSSITNSNGTVLNPSTCGCNTGYLWTVDSNGGVSCACTTNCGTCNTTTSVIIGTICYNCSSVLYSTGPLVGTSQCICPSSFIWDWNTISLIGSCKCANSQKIPSVSGTCICNSSIYIPQTNGSCFSCVGLSYGAGTTQSANTSACACLYNFVFIWNSVTESGTCGCLSPLIINSNGTACVCDPTKTITLTNGTCFSCLSIPYSLNTSTGVICNCISPMVWNSSTLACDCNSSSALVVSGSAWSCVNCLTASFTKAKATNISCTCNGTGLTWNSLGYCDCGSLKAMIISGTTFTCITCNATVFSIGKNDSYSCACSSPLTWIKATSICDCSSTSIRIVTSGIYSCLTCNASIYASTKLNSTVCTCVSTLLTWNSTSNNCGCSNTSAIFLSATGTYSCTVCNATIFALSKASATSCNCISALFTWKSNIGCVCLNTNAVIVGTGSTATCVVCNSSIYSSGINSTTVCNCLGSLTWQNGSCGCGTTSVISFSGNTYSCLACNSSIFATSKLNATYCKCASTVLVWKPLTYTCDCVDNVNSVIFVSGTTYKCVVCNSTVFASNRLTFTSCNCLNSASTTWNKTSGKCDCNSTAALYSSTTTPLCFNCDSSIYSTAKSSSTACTCASTAFTWTGKTCGCAVNKIILSNLTCLACTSNAIFSNFTCQCASSNTTMNSFWNDITKTCGVCGSTSYLKSVTSTSNYVVACKCLTGYIWDVMTNACILACTSVTCTMNCSKIPNVVTGGVAAAGNTTKYRNIVGGDLLATNYINAGSNYNYISTLACPCVSGYSWDGKRLRCFSNQINLV